MGTIATNKRACRKFEVMEVDEDYEFALDVHGLGAYPYFLWLGSSSLFLLLRYGRFAVLFVFALDVLLVVLYDHSSRSWSVLGIEIVRIMMCLSSSFRCGDKFKPWDRTARVIYCKDERPIIGSGIGDFKLPSFPC